MNLIDTKYPEIPAAIKQEKVLSDDNEQTLIKAIKEFKTQFK